MKKTEEQLSKYFNKQYLQYGGFCGTCGEGVEPILNEDIETFGLCPFGGNHDLAKNKEKGGK